MELNAHIARFEVLQVSAESAHIRLTTFTGEEYELHVAAGDAVEVRIPEELQTETYSLLEKYLSKPMPSDLMEGATGEEPGSLQEPAARPNRILEELQTLEPQLRHSICPECGDAERLTITHEGIVVLCQKCGQMRRVDAQLLQLLIDALGVPCFSCSTGRLRSQSTDYANILVCQNPACGSNNSWRGVSDRIHS